MSTDGLTLLLVWIACVFCYVVGVLVGAWLF